MARININTQVRSGKMFKQTCLLSLLATIGLSLSLPAQATQVEVNQQSGVPAAAVAQANSDQEGIRNFGRMRT